MDPIFDDNDPLSFLGKDDAPEPEAAPPPPVAAEGEGEGEEASNEPQTHRDLQRGALQELVDLVAECSAHEAQVEQELSSSLSETQGSGQRKLTDTERKYKAVQEQIASKFEEKRTEIEGRYEQAAAKLKSHDQNQRHRIKTEFDLAQQQIKKDYDQAIWLAESVMEAEEGKASEELKKATELNTTQTEYLNEKEGQAEALMQRYNAKPPPGESIAVLKEAESKTDPATSFNEHKAVMEKQVGELAALSVPRLFIGVTPYLIGAVVLVIAAGIPLFMSQLRPTIALAYWVGGA